MAMVDSANLKSVRLLKTMATQAQDNGQHSLSEQLLRVVDVVVEEFSNIEARISASFLLHQSRD